MLRKEDKNLNLFDEKDGVLIAAESCNLQVH